MDLYIINPYANGAKFIQIHWAYWKKIYQTKHDWTLEQLEQNYLDFILKGAL